MLKYAKHIARWIFFERKQKNIYLHPEPVQRDIGLSFEERPEELSL